MVALNLALALTQAMGLFFDYGFAPAVLPLPLPLSLSLSPDDLILIKYLMIAKRVLKKVLVSLKDYLKRESLNVMKPF